MLIGGAMTAFWLNVLWSMSSQLFWEKEQGNLSLYIIAPNSMMAVLLGMAMRGMLAPCLRAIVILGLGSWLFEVSYQVVNFGQLFVVFILAMAALYGMGMMTSSLFLLFGREAWHIANLAQEPIYLAAGFYFPVKSLGFWIAAGASVIPLTLALDAMRQLSYPGGGSLAKLKLREVITDCMMTLHIPANELLKLGEDLKKKFPQRLERISSTTLIELLNKIDPTPDSVKESGAKDWGDLSDRIHFIADLFRTYFEYSPLSNQPFSNEQVEILKKGIKPEGNL